jgi:hypothetical protein
MSLGYLSGYSPYGAAFLLQNAGCPARGARPGGVIRGLRPIEDARGGFLRHRAMKRPIDCTEGRRYPVVSPASTVSGVLMLPLPWEAIAKQQFSA